MDAELVARHSSLSSWSSDPNQCFQETFIGVGKELSKALMT